MRVRALCWRGVPRTIRDPSLREAPVKQISAHGGCHTPVLIPVVTRYSRTLFSGHSVGSTCERNSRGVVSRAGWTPKGACLRSFLGHLSRGVGVFRCCTQRPAQHALFRNRVCVLRGSRISSVDPTAVSRSPATAQSRYPRCVCCSSHIRARIDMGLRRERSDWIVCSANPRPR
jgi:hypothetical protein